jgi:N-acetyltransferase
LCDLSYNKGAEDDEALHKTHCARVQQGMEWGREEEKDGIRDGQSIILEVENDIKLTGAKDKGRIISFSAEVNGKIGAKVSFSLTSKCLPIGELKQTTPFL